MSLYLKYRPKTLEEIEGNEDLLKSLSSVLERKEGIPHAILFTGPSGNGKTTLARIVRTVLNCGDNDYYECNTADFNGIDTIREIRQKMQYKPTSGETRVWLIDEAHRLSGPAQHAFLKMLEDTPNHVYFILATTNPEKLIKTIKTRCSTFEVEELSPRRIQRLLDKVIEAEDASVPEEVVKQISQDCMGSCRSALVILDSIINMDEDDMLKAASQKATEENEVKELCQTLLKGGSWKEVSTILKGITAEPETVRRQVLGYMNSVLLNSGKERASDVIEEFLGNFFDSGKAGLTQACFRLN